MRNPTWISCRLPRACRIRAFGLQEQDLFMPRSVILTLFTVVASLAGCGRNDTGEPPVRVPADPMVLIPAGVFTMGDGDGRADENPHAVAVSAFYLDRYPVTQEMYEKVTGINPSKHKG